MFLSRYFQGAVCLLSCCKEISGKEIQKCLGVCAIIQTRYHTRQDKDEQISVC